MSRKEEAKGIPSRKYYGSPTEEFKPGDIIDYVIQRHLAERAGPHYDLRAGDRKRGLHSWVTRKELPEAGGRIGLIHQPVHSYRYKDFEGTIPPGYGAGKVSKESEGKALVTKTKPGKEIHFTTADNKPERRYAVIRTGKEDDYQWLLSRPHNIADTGARKPKYKNIPPHKIDKRLDELKGDEHVQPKIDGALNFLRLIENKPELLSHRLSKETGLPIIHTEKFFGGRPELKDLPKELHDSVLLSEVYGLRKGQAIPPQELGGLLNATTHNSLQKQKETDTELKGVLFDIARRGKQQINPEEVSYSDRRMMIEELLKYLPSDKFELPEEVQGKDEAKSLLNKIRKGHHPLTQEGVVIHPEKGRSEKVKLTNEHDVYVRDIFPGEGKYFKSGAGGIKYSLTPDGPVVGKVGTGLSDEMRRLLFKNPEEFIGRIARIRSQGQFEGGAHRAPSLIALHEDY